MLAAAVSGHVFASPSARAVLAAIRAVGGKAGCLLIVYNYTGTKSSRVSPPSPSGSPLFCVGVSQREAWINHELLVNHAWRRVLFLLVLYSLQRCAHLQMQQVWS